MVVVDTILLLLGTVVAGAIAAGLLGLLASAIFKT